MSASQQYEEKIFWKIAKLRLHHQKVSGDLGGHQSVKWCVSVSPFVILHTIVHLHNTWQYNPLPYITFKITYIVAVAARTDMVAL